MLVSKFNMSYKIIRLLSNGSKYLTCLCVSHDGVATCGKNNLYIARLNCPVYVRSADMATVAMEYQ